MSNTLNLRAFSEAVAIESGTTYKAADKAVRATLDVLAKAVSSGDAVRISNFGTFSRVLRAETVRRNPQTGETVNVPAHYVVKFAPTGRLFDRVRAGESVDTIAKTPKGAL
jgi:nucleoid DNA-binding protein